MTHEALPATPPPDPTIPLTGEVLPLGPIIPEGFTLYDPNIHSRSKTFDGTTVPGESKKDRTARALEALDMIYNSTEVAEGFYGPSDRLALDEHNYPILLRPVTSNEAGRIRYDIIRDENDVIKRPMLAPPSARTVPTQPTRKSIKAEKHMFHATEKRDEHLIRARLQAHATEGLTTPARLGVKANEVDTPMFNKKGKRVAANPDNPNLRSYNDLTYPEKMNVFLSSKPKRSEKRVAKKALKIYEKSVEKGMVYREIVAHHGHDTRRKVIKPWTWVRRSRGSSNTHDTGHAAAHTPDLAPPPPSADPDDPLNTLDPPSVI